MTSSSCRWNRCGAPPWLPARFLERYGPRLHSLALYVDDPADLVGHLRARGLRLSGSAGGELTDPRDEIWTHPAELPCPFEFFEPREATGDPRRNEPDWSPAYWRDEHPMGIIGATYVVVTPDRAAATAQLVDALRARLVRESVGTPHGTRSDFLALGDPVVLEIAQPTDETSRAAQGLAGGGTFHAVSFQVADLERSLRHVAEKGVGFERVADGHAVLDPADTHGVLFRLTDREPGA